MAESFFASLKVELIDRRSWATRAQVLHAVFDYIERFFNRRRLHSSLDYLTPAEYEATKIHHHKAAPHGIVRLSGKPGQRQTSPEVLAEALTEFFASSPEAQL